MRSRGCISVLQQSIAIIFRRDQDSDTSDGERSPLISNDSQISKQGRCYLPTSRLAERSPTIINGDGARLVDVSQVFDHPSPIFPPKPTNDDVVPLLPSPELVVASRHSRLPPDAQSLHSRSFSIETSTEKYSLRRQLQDEERDCDQFDNRFIIPRSRLAALLTINVIARDIGGRRPEIDEVKAVEYAQLICKCARQIYATLIYVKKEADICELLEEGLSDSDLPLKPDSQYQFWTQDGQRVVQTLNTWTLKKLKKFKRTQHSITAPVFETLQHYDFDDETILPFIQLKDKDVPESVEGGYSRVYPVRIHPGHNKFWEPSRTEADEPLIAVKELFSSSEADFKKEETILRKLAHKRHPHLIELLATFKWRERYHLMFRWADANLRTYWEDRPLPTFDETTVFWSLHQMSGIANALKAIHVLRMTDYSSYPVPLETPKGVSLSVKEDEVWYGRHGDIKAENILWFKDDKEAQGVFQVADFGLARFHKRGSRSRVDPEIVKASPTYEPPEHILGLPISRAYDLWSLGCLYLEFVTWLLKGFDEIIGFSDFRGQVSPLTGFDDDNFYTVLADDGARPRGAIVRKQVWQWVNDLHAHDRCSQLIHDILDMTMEDLLKVDSHQRISSNDLHVRFTGYLENVVADKDYMLKPVPYQPPQLRAS